MVFPSDSVLNLSQAALLVSLFSRQLDWSQSLLSPLAYLIITFSDREGPRESDQFQKLPEANFRCLPSDLKSFPEG